MKLCVYALTGSAARLSARGASGERLRLVRDGSIAAVVGELSRTPPPSPESLRRYDRTMRVLAAALPAVLPARFGACFDDLDEVKFVLRTRRPSLSRALAHVRNRVQMTVRVIDRSTSPAGAPRGAEARVARPLPRPKAAAAIRDVRAEAWEGGGPPGQTGTAYLRARAERAARDREVPGFEPVRAAVRRWVRDERIDRRTQVTTVYHLVPRSSADVYRRAIDRAAAEAGLQLVVTGPWPAYAFAENW